MFGELLLYDPNVLGCIVLGVFFFGIFIGVTIARLVIDVIILSKEKDK